MRIVVTGGTGLIGSHLRRGLGDHEWVLLTPRPGARPRRRGGGGGGSRSTGRPRPRHCVGRMP